MDYSPNFREWLDEAYEELGIPHSRSGRGLYIRTYNCICRNVGDVEELAKLTDDDILRMRGCGKQSAEIIRQVRDYAAQEIVKHKLEPITIVLCGPLSNRVLFDMVETILTARYRDRGSIILKPYLFQDAGEPFRAALVSEVVKRKVHFKKIDQADLVVIVDGLYGDSHIGLSTEAEIEYAIANNKTVVYLSKLLYVNV